MQIAFKALNIKIQYVDVKIQLEMSKCPTSKMLNRITMKRKTPDEQSTNENDNKENCVEEKKIKTESPLNDTISVLKERFGEEENINAALKEFIRYTKKNNALEFVTIYMKTSPECKELFSLFGQSGRPQPERLQLLWGAFEGILCVTSENKENHMLNSSGIFLSSKIIEHHMKAIYFSFGVSAKDSLIISLLKFLTYVIAQSRQTLKDLVNNFDFGHRGFKAASTNRNKKQEPDVRTCFVRFCLAFFVFGDMNVIIKLLEEKGFGALILNNLHQDTSNSILVVLETLENKVVNNESILKKTKLVFFNADVLSKLSFLCNNPNEEVSRAAMQLLTVLTTDTKRGIVFFPRDGVHTGKLMNIVLMKFLQNIRQRLNEYSKLFSLAMDVMRQSPDIIVPFFNTLSMNMDPRPSEAYFKDLQFVTMVWKNISPISKMRMVLNVNKNFDFLLKLVIPSVISKAQVAAALKHKNKKIQNLSFELLEVVLHRCIDLKDHLLKCIESSASINNNKTWEKLQIFLDLITQSLPDVKNVITVRQSIIQKSSFRSLNKATEDISDDEIDELQELPMDPTTNPEELVQEKKRLHKICTKALWHYQTLKPGVLTESGFNVCKLFLMKAQYLDDEIVECILDILILERTNTRMWLEKKISGGSNILFMLLETMASYCDCKIILRKGKTVFFKIMNLQEDFGNMPGEFEMWVDQLISLTKAEETKDDIRTVCKKFSDACLRYLSEPYVFKQQVHSILQQRSEDADSLSSKKLEFSPLVIAVVEQFTKIECSELDQRFFTSTMHHLIASQHDLKSLLLVITSLAREGEKGKVFGDCFQFSYTLWECLSEEDVVEREQIFHNLKSEKENIQEEDPVDLLTILRTLIISKSGKKVIWKKTLTKLTSNEAAIKGSISKQSNKILCAKIMCNIFRLLQRTTYPKETTTRFQCILDFFVDVLKLILEGTENCASKLIIYDILLKPFEEFSEIEDEVWRKFAQDVLLLVFTSQNTHDSSQMYENPTVLENLAKEITPGMKKTAENVIKSLYKNDYITEEFNTFLRSFLKQMPVSILRQMMPEISNCLHDVASLSPEALAAFVEVFESLLKKRFPIQECKELLNDLNLKSLFLSASRDKSEIKMKLFHSAYSVLPSAELIKGLTFQQYSKVFSCCGQTFIDAANLVLKANRHISDGFLQSVIGHDRDFTKVELVCMVDLIESALLIYREESLPHRFVSKLTTEIWDALLSLDECNEKIMSVLRRIFKHFHENRMVETFQAFVPKVTEKDTLGTVTIYLSILRQFLSNLKDDCQYQIEAAYHIITIIPKSVEEIQSECISCLKDILAMLHPLKDKTKSVRKILPVWKDFVVYCLKEHYKSNLFMSMLSLATEKLYSSKSFSKYSNLSLKELYDMVVGHSNFLEVFIDEHALCKESKDALVSLLHALIKRLPSSCDSALIPIILMAYNASLSNTDQRLLFILKIYEENGNPMSKYFPLSWGPAAVHKFKYKEQHPQSTMLSDVSSVILNSLDVKMITKTAYEFPIHVKFQGVHSVEDDTLYDPRFLLLVISGWFQPGQFVNCKQFFESGCLLLTIAALTSRDAEIRRVAYFILLQYNEQLDSARFREKNQVVYLLLLLKNSITEENIQLHSVWGAFLCRYISILLRADHQMYTALNHQLLRKPTLSLNDLPVFLNFFHGSSTEHQSERFWFLKLLLNGLKDQSGYYLYKRHHVFELILCNHDSTLSDKKCRPIIIDLINNACKFFNAAFDLEKVHSITSWLGNFINRHKGEERVKFIEILHTMKETFKKGRLDVQTTSDDIVEETKEKTPFPVRFAHEAYIVCLSCLRGDNNLSQREMTMLCSIITWVLSIPSKFGGVVTWAQTDDIHTILMTFQRLLTLDDTREEIWIMFKDLVLLFLEKHGNKFFPVLSELCLEKIHDRAAQWNAIETYDLFTIMQRWKSQDSQSLEQLLERVLRCSCMV